MANKENIIADWLGSGSLNIFGRPFAGKDTQGEKLAEMFDGHLIAGGDILRHYQDQSKIKEMMSHGELIPTDFYLEIVLPFLSQDKFEGQPLILSSVGRMKGEEKVILDATFRSGHPTKAAILLELSENDVWQRYDQSKSLNDRGDRSDDNRQVLKTRLEEFEEKTQPVIDFYEKEGLLLVIDGRLPRDDVTEQILKSLERLAETR